MARPSLLVRADRCFDRINDIETAVVLTDAEYDALNEFAERFRKGVKDAQYIENDATRQHRPVRANAMTFSVKSEREVREEIARLFLGVMASMKESVRLVGDQQLAAEYDAAYERGDNLLKDQRGG